MAEEHGLTLPDSENFRQVLGRLPTGVVIVTGGDAEKPSGLVCGSFMSVSLQPPLVAVAPAKSSTSWPRSRQVASSAPTCRRKGRRTWRGRFSASGGDKFSGIDWRPAPATGAPLLSDAAAWIDCRVYKQIEAGDHWLVLGEVLELSVQREGGALVFHGGSFHPLG